MAKHHLVTRNTGLMSTANNHSGYVNFLRENPVINFSQEKAGAKVFRIDKQPNIDDVIWLKESDYGVVAKGKILRVHDVKVINCVEDIDNIRYSEDIFEFLRVDDGYWNQIRTKLDDKPTRPIYFHGFDIRITEIFDIAFPGIPANAQLPWFSFEELKLSKYLFQDLNIEDYIVLHGNDKAYFNISDSMKSRINRLCGIGNAIDEEYDHHVPKNCGGPGVFIENVFPLPQRINVQKLDRIYYGIILHAKYLIKIYSNDIFPDLESMLEKYSTKMGEWDEKLNYFTAGNINYDKYLEQRRITQYIVHLVWRWTAHNQAVFYHNVFRLDYERIIAKESIWDEEIKRAYSKYDYQLYHNSSSYEYVLPLEDINIPKRKLQHAPKPKINKSKNNV